MLQEYSDSRLITTLVLQRCLLLFLLLLQVLFLLLLFLLVLLLLQVLFFVLMPKLPDRIFNRVQARSLKCEVSVESRHRRHFMVVKCGEHFPQTLIGVKLSSKRHYFNISFQRYQHSHLRIEICRGAKNHQRIKEYLITCKEDDNDDDNPDMIIQ